MPPYHYIGSKGLRGLVEAAFPRNISEVLDVSLVLAPYHDGDGAGASADEAAAGRRGSDGCYGNRTALGVRSCVERLAELGLKCAADSPGDRPAIGRVYAEVVAIREAFSSALEFSGNGNE
ncbi:putative LRR receptor-like serine/threonine-protein kinase [Panicum miliaceum]|uniref:LRR receptor-like serine/threonine-protein kinase n=1 Tax=Panicum miliaceum TaxID=4540 RepID=A0A3L6Q1K4_PANMI|nr:putative LRR receptor-like serine/threonine-protein kinase [Panicum miliaceum]